MHTDYYRPLGLEHDLSLSLPASARSAGPAGPSGWSCSAAPAGRLQVTSRTAAVIRAFPDIAVN